MKRILYVVPTRGRPDHAVALAAAWRETTDDAELVFALDQDDLTLADYVRVADRISPAWMRSSDTHSMVESLNRAAMIYAERYEYIGFMGDDHRPRTPHWDSIIYDRMRLDSLILAYGNDLVQGPNLPTAVLMRSDAILTLGQMAPQSLTHLYVDNYWLRLGRDSGRMAYVPEVVIQHEHPITGKVPWTEGHKRVNEGSMYERDRRAFELYEAGGYMHEDVLKVKDL